MAFPTILVDSTNGAASDTACSGAGPTTALTGTAGATDAAGTTVTLDALTDLTNVDTTGLHVIYLADTTAGHRRFAKITGTAGSGGATPTVTVSEAFTTLLAAKSWAIGGVRATHAGAVSKLLFDNNGSAGDAMPGWTEQFQSGHTETVTAQFDMRRAGDTTSGAITLRGASGAATLPVITFSNNGRAYVPRNSLTAILDFDMRNSNGTKNASIAIDCDVIPTAQVRIRGMKIANSTNNFWKGILVASGTDVRSNEVGYCASIGIGNSAQSQANGVRILFNYVHHCVGVQISLTAIDIVGGVIYGNIVYAGTTHGLLYDNTGTAENRAVFIAQNTFDSNGGDGFRTTQATAAIGFSWYVNNISSNNAGYGFNFTSGTVTSTWLGAYGAALLNNNTYNNTSGASNPASILVNDPGLNPSYTNAAAGDFSIGTNLKALGFPLAGTLYVGKYSTTYDYIDPGAAQRAEAGGGSSIGAQIFGG